MAPRTTIRIPAALLAGGLLLAPLAGCTVSSENVSCSTSSCTVRLSGDTSEVEILGTTLGFGGVQDGRASLEVAGTSVSCAEGEAVRAGTLTLECTSVSDDSVEVTASLG
ncbi:hypothetical protein OF117_13165 [Geodermatophilus sp. YIM 151500]|uniref:hypothetical protein n=1 Tax=Geodermatophilus sp. YIM 151500 TaxID=2984531 RepID=UPI0021E4AFE3|nr:hypothetical protein [Geodermatophilus sp. YIM 151500]MCV2490313.1 hypothetical protein [Geodermatophilus sp. YIM 151500]